MAANSAQPAVATFEPRDQDGRQPVQRLAGDDEPVIPAEAYPTPLTSDEIGHFEEHGFVLLKRAFSAEAAEDARACLWARVAQDGITRDPSTWTMRRHGIAEVYTPDAEPWDRVITPRLRGAIEQLCGTGRTGRFGCGWWVVTFPGVAEPPWGVDGKWHVDGFGYTHHPDSPEIGLLPIFLFNDLSPGDGGTLLVPGSHRTVAQILWENEGVGVEGGKLSSLARRNLDEATAVEVNGSAGDVMLAHPFLLHARSKNLGQRGLDSVRFMSHPAVPLRARMNVGRNSTEAPTPVEAPILAVRPEAPPSREAQECALEEAEMMRVMGFGGFKRTKKPKN